MTPTSRKLIQLALIMFLSWGCSSPSANLLAEDVAPGMEYLEVLEVWTRTNNAYVDFESRVRFSATYLSKQLRRAMVKEYSQIFRPNKEDLTTFENQYEVLAERYEVFFISVFTNNREWNDLELSSSIWKLYLETDQGVRLSPMDITPVRSANLVLAHFFPHMGHFTAGYWVYFPRYPEYQDKSGLPRPCLSQDSSSFKLLLSSPVGKSDLEWKLNNKR